MKKYIIVTVISAIIIQSLALFGAFAGNLNGNNVFTLDFNGASALGPVTGENDAVTNTWLSEAYNQNCINFYFEPGVTEEFSIESGLFGKNASDKALRIKGYDGNNNTRMGISPWGVNPAYNNAASIDCGANGSFVFSFDFATSNLLSPAQIASARTIEFVRGILTERQTYGQGLFSLKADGSIQIFNDVITADEIKAAIGKNITENEWYTIKIVFNASNQMGLLINGKVVRQMATLTNASATSSLRALGVELRFYANLGKDASLTEEQAKRLMELGLSNQIEDPNAKTTGRIIRENVLTFFNLVFLVLAVLLVLAGRLAELTARPYVVFVVSRPATASSYAS